MCTLLIAIDRHPDYRWVIAANRDEFHDRPTAPMGWWRDHSDLLAGRDLQAGGTWMGLTRSGRFAALTNFREARCVYPRGPSRGFLVSDFLTSSLSPDDYLDRVSHRAQRYDGFNLVVGDVKRGLYYYGNRCGNAHAEEVAPGPPAPPQRLGAGIYGISNHRIDTPWPKVKRGKALLRQHLNDSGARLEQRLLGVLADTGQPADADLPDTGVGLAWERILAPLFINSPQYGTRSCSVVRLDRHGLLSVVERTLPPPGGAGVQPAERRFRFRADGG